MLIRPITMRCGCHRLINLLAHRMGRQKRLQLQLGFCGRSHHLHSAIHRHNWRAIELDGGKSQWMTKKTSKMLRWTDKNVISDLVKCLSNEETKTYTNVCAEMKTERLFSHSAIPHIHVRTHEAFKNYGIIFSVFWQLNHILTIFGIFFLFCHIGCFLLLCVFIWLNCISRPNEWNMKKEGTHTCAHSSNPKIKTVQTEEQHTSHNRRTMTLYLPQQRGWN